LKKLLKGAPNKGGKGGDKRLIRRGKNERAHKKKKVTGQREQKKEKK